ncbi:aspartate-semialdehyde dehydrogenase [Marinilactibacillus sp. Marseille-P9653]|uniref:aspartate-semialdehyde dehydrogenase n=1 Tax=Marinilactibacillus sp. Marseille-P9653 TaxID=2866583 RepID=UPI001CE3EB78|nr:aspartate-semialdehyde dehydrogenase [Marinilactibacillus sp. Marseille-P9653]
MCKIAVVGATGLVGSTMLRLLEEKNIPIEELTLFSSARSAGTKVIFKDEELVVEELTPEKTTGPFDYVLMSAGGETSLTFSPLFEQHGAVVIDNSSAWRMDPEISLVVPEVNPPVLDRKIIANPNCSTIQSVGPLKLLLDAFGIERVAYTTYQSVSGSGWKGIEDLKRGEQGKEPLNYPYPIYNNVIPHIDVFQEDGYTKEEVKMIEETRKILSLPTLPVTATCVRVPVTSAHSVAMNVTLTKETTVQNIQQLFEESPYVTLVDDPKNDQYPMPIQAGGKEGIFVGRIRKDDSLKNTYHVWTVSDNILKGAALNAVQILQQLTN